MSTRSIDLLPKLESAFSEQKWDELLSLLNPKLFSTPESEELIAFPCLSKVAEILQAEEPVVPNNIKVVCLKCLGNSCFNGYKHKEYSSTNVEYGTYCLELYSKLITNNENLKKSEIYILYPFHSHFPYESVIEWTVNFIKSYKFNEDLMDDQLEILRLCIQFLCNLFTFACKNSSFDDQCSIPTFLYDTNLKSIIMNLTNFDHIPSVRASCIFIHNALREFEGQNFTNLEKTRLCSQLLKPIKKGFESAKEALMCLLYQSNLLRISYNDMNIEDKLYLLEIIHNEVSDSVYGCESDHLLRKDAINFLSERFCKRSDILLKTVDSYLDNMEPREIIILLDILGTVTSRSAKACQSIENYKSLLINCTYLLRSIQMIGKESNNYFTPMQKLSDIAKMMEETKNNGLQQNLSSTETEDNEYKDIRERKDLCSHPAFGFKAGLIRIIGNVSYRNKECQDLVREMDAIPLLLDCCNIDARNPLIMQWTILALRNLCEDNPENQEIVQNCTRTGVVENSVLREMGVTLHEDESGQKIGIVPLDLNKK
ncbi:Ataxin-10 [Dufourea novaeangliae]|uniref:Ataxin-10 n=2 Tax=Dufourea novaeangliae TaxID=178035 RepID=A0A154PHB5_DUFNO|nr:Ataxin-10 [Dufourea novaeangliae]